jgi:beta-glucosidase
MKIKSILVFSLLSFVIIPAQSISKYPYQNKLLTPELRALDLIGRMHLNEKIAQMECVNYELKNELFDSTGNINKTVLDSKYKAGLGQIAEFCKSQNWFDPQKGVEVYNQLQHYFIENTRLGIPIICHEESLHGIVAKDGTSFPHPIALAGTFNLRLVEQLYTMAAEEARARGVQQVLSPVIDVAREPRWGRCEETFGEDPYLVGEMGVSAIKGFQGDNTFSDNKHVIATVKHFAAHSQPENGTNLGPVDISPRTLYEVFLYPFEQAVKRAGVSSIMASYNELDGIPSHANKWLLTDLLRDTWGFKGYVVSDYFAIGQLNSIHHVASDWTDAARLSIEAGVNIELPKPEAYSNIKKLLHQGLITEKQLDKLVVKLLEYKFKLGLFDNPYLKKYVSANQSKNSSLALEAARQSIVMLKSNELAPLDLSKIKTIAVIGPNANRVLLGGYAGQPIHFVTVLEGIKNFAGAKANVLYSEGCKITTTDSEGHAEIVKPEENIESIAKAVQLAKQADVIILAVGGNEQTSNEGGDRMNLDLVGSQNQLIDSIAATGKPIIAVVIHGSPISFVNLSLKVSTLFDCWYLGQECGTAIADVIFGNYNPSGKLSISIPRSAAQLPCYYNYKPSARRGYLFETSTPLYPFGYGLSYTNFSVKNLRLSKSSISRNENVTVSVDVKNEGNLFGTEVVQMYIHDKVSSVTRPVKELKGFQRVELKAGESKVVEMVITPAQLAFYDQNMKFKVEPGEFEVMVGNSSQDQDLKSIILKVIKD